MKTGLLAIPFPQLLGNGKGVAQEVFDSNIGLTLVVVRLLLRVLVTLGALRVDVTFDYIHARAMRHPKYLGDSRGLLDS